MSASSSKKEVVEKSEVVNEIKTETTTTEKIVETTSNSKDDASILSPKISAPAVLGNAEVDDWNEDKSLNLDDDFKTSGSAKSSNVAYSDKVCVLKLGDRSLNAGHTRIISKKKETLRQVNVDELTHLFTISSYTASVLFETLKAQGTNIILNQAENLEISIVPRFENDGLGLMWEMKQGDSEKVQAAANKIKDKLVIGEIKDFSKVNLDEEETEEVTPHVVEKVPAAKVIPKSDEKTPSADDGKKVNIVDRAPPKTEAPKKNYLFDGFRRIP
jgi:diadenosine tetraphosphate (Ap4A) HIT family hydrolase